MQKRNNKKGLEKNIARFDPTYTYLTRHETT